VIVPKMVVYFLLMWGRTNKGVSFLGTAKMFLEDCVMLLEIIVYALLI
jgi:hypothetical protein